MNELRPDADFLSLLCNCAHLLAIEGNEVLILNLLWQSSAFQVKDSPDLYSILKIKRMNLCMLTEGFVYSQPAPEDMLTVDRNCVRYRAKSVSFMAYLRDDICTGFFHFFHQVGINFGCQPQILCS